MPGTLNKVLLGAGAAGVGVAAWQKTFPWIKYDVQMMKVIIILIYRGIINLSTPLHTSLHPFLYVLLVYLIFMLFSVPS